MWQLCMWVGGRPFDSDAVSQGELLCQAIPFSMGPG
jgi:hypothetical protein